MLQSLSTLQKHGNAAMHSMEMHHETDSSSYELRWGYLAVIEVRAWPHEGKYCRALPVSVYKRDTAVPVLRPGLQL